MAANCIAWIPEANKGTHSLPVFSQVELWHQEVEEFFTVSSVPLCIKHAHRPDMDDCGRTVVAVADHM